MQKLFLMHVHHPFLNKKLRNKSIALKLFSNKGNMKRYSTYLHNVLYRNLILTFMKNFNPTKWANFNAEPMTRLGCNFHPPPWCIISSLKLEISPRNPG